MKFTIKHISELEKVSDAVIDLMKEHKIFLLNGEMGVGKTTFMKTLGQELKIEDEVSSPTYSIANEYALPNGQRLYHFDLYRIKELEELLEMGFEEYLYSGNYCFVEWPEIANELFPENCVLIDMNSKKGDRFFELIPFNNVP